MPANGSAVTETGEFSYTEILSPQYDDARTFSEDLAAVKRGDKWGYINLDGEVVIDFQYDRANSFSEGKALVEKHVMEDGYVTRYYHIITLDNKSVQLQSGGRNFSNLDGFFDGGWLNEMYDTTFYNGYILVPADSPSGTFVFDQYGQDFDDSAFLPTEGTLAKYNHYSDIHEEEYTLLYDQLGFISARPFNQEMAPVAFEDPNDMKGYYYSFLNKKGTLWSGPKFYNFYVNDVHKSYKVFNDNSLASVMNAEGKWGAVSKGGTIVLPFKYEGLRPFTEGTAAFLQNGKFGFIDIRGNVIIPPQFEDASAFANGLAAVRQRNTAYIIDKEGNKIKGTENLPVNAYFVEDGLDEDGNTRYTVTSPGKYVLTKENNKYGFGKIDYKEKVTNVTGINLDKTKLEIEAGKSATLVATVFPVNATNKKITWTSSNEKIAAVDAYGHVTALAVGKATITVTADDGKYTASIEVFVSPSTSVPDPYEAYTVWKKPLKNEAVNHNWTITLNMNVNAASVNDESVYIIDKEYNKLDFIHSKTTNNGVNGHITLENSGNFKKDEEYWIIIEESVKSSDGKKLKKGLKAPFIITK